MITRYELSIGEPSLRAQRNYARDVNAKVTGSMQCHTPSLEASPNRSYESGLLSLVVHHLIMSLTRAD